MAISRCCGAHQELSPSHMADRGSGGLLACSPGEGHVSPGGGAGSAGGGACRQQAADPVRPARTAASAFGRDEDLATELPPNWTLRRFQEEVKALMAEYFVSRAVEDTADRVVDLLKDCPSEADELGVLAIRAALDRDDKVAQKAVVDLICSLNKRGTLDRAALIRSFEKLFCTWEDISIDAPHAPKGLLEVLHGCMTGGAAERPLLTKVPEALLKAGLSQASPELKELMAGIAEELKEFKLQASRRLEEYFVTLNTDETLTSLRELKMPSYHHEFVKKAITLSFSQPQAEPAREAILQLFADLSSANILTKDDLQWGVTRLLGQLDDLELDCPHVVELATDFCVCLVADELVSAPFLRRCRLLRIGGATGLRVLEGTQRKTPEYSKKNLGTAQLKREFHTMILEYLNSGDEVEFGRCIRELAPLSPEQSAELIRKIMVFAMERSGSECELALRLLVWLCRHEELDSAAIEGGFNDLYARMPDLLLDVPDAEDMARSFVVEAKKAKVLRRSWPEPEEE